MALKSAAEEGDGFTMAQRSDASFSFVMGIVAGASTTVLIAMSIAVIIRVKWMEDWQTLVTGTMAVGAAVMTVLVIRKQIVQVYETADEERSRELLAARSMLPVTLSRICWYSEACASVLRPKYIADPDEVVEPVAFVAPSLPDDDLANLSRCIRYGDETLQRAVSKLLAQLQIQSSRLRSFAADMRPGGTAHQGGAVHEFLVDAIELYARASGLFDFARQETNSASESVTLEEMQSAANNLNVRRLGFLNVHLMIERRYG